MDRATTLMENIDRAAIPDWAVKRACEIAHCGWNIQDLRQHSLRDSYVFTIWRIAQHVMENEEEPADPLLVAVLRGIETKLRDIKLHDISGWPGMVPIAHAVVTSIRDSGLTHEEVFR